MDLIPTRLVAWLEARSRAIRILLFIIGLRVATFWYFSAQFLIANGKLLAQTLCLLLLGTLLVTSVKFGIETGLQVHALEMAFDLLNKELNDEIKEFVRTTNQTLDNLSQSLAEATAPLPQTIRTAVIEAVGEMDQKLDNLYLRLYQSHTEAIAALPLTVRSVVDEALGDLVGDMDRRLDNLSQTLAEATATLPQTVKTAVVETVGEMDQKLDNLYQSHTEATAALPLTVRSVVDEALGDLVSDMDRRLDNLSQSLAEATATLPQTVKTAVVETVGEMDQKLDNLYQSHTEATAALPLTVRSVVDEALGDLVGDMNRKLYNLSQSLTEATTALPQTVKTVVVETVGEMEQKLDNISQFLAEATATLPQTVKTAVIETVGEMDQKLDNLYQSHTEATAALPLTVRSVVDEALGDLGGDMNRKLDNLSQSLTEATTALPQTVKTVVVETLFRRTVKAVVVETVGEMDQKLDNLSQSLAEATAALPQTVKAVAVETVGEMDRKLDNLSQSTGAASLPQTVQSLVDKAIADSVSDVWSKLDGLSQSLAEVTSLARTLADEVVPASIANVMSDLGRPRQLLAHVEESQESTSTLHVTWTSPPVCGNDGVVAEQYNEYFAVVEPSYTQTYDGNESEEAILQHSETVTLASGQSHTAEASSESYNMSDQLPELLTSLRALVQTSVRSRPHYYPLDDNLTDPGASGASGARRAHTELMQQVTEVQYNPLSSTSDPLPEADMAHLIQSIIRLRGQTCHGQLGPVTDRRSSGSFRSIWSTDADIPLQTLLLGTQELVQIHSLVPQHPSPQPLFNTEAQGAGCYPSNEFLCAVMDRINELSMHLQKLVQMGGRFNELAPVQAELVVAQHLAVVCGRLNFDDCAEVTLPGDAGSFALLCAYFTERTATLVTAMHQVEQVKDESPQGSSAFISLRQQIIEHVQLVHALYTSVFCSKSHAHTRTAWIDLAVIADDLQGAWGGHMDLSRSTDFLSDTLHERDRAGKVAKRLWRNYDDNSTPGAWIVAKVVHLFLNLLYSTHVGELPQ
ncbi:hypothetical protein EVJ58_g6254 [Rhodofomes roseus]|uniref:Uncharacterized protein n=1 Tax=Rhodofomes roseus TaxID=34475 RepID=A0A4Y9Y9J6_9APHY|nr:hypothetical protein EVJ58_g6254 [Rhodofomes roseus]